MPVLGAPKEEGYQAALIYHRFIANDRWMMAEARQRRAALG
ncbi:hypothetical protein [Edwardsiella tarda]